MRVMRGLRRAAATATVAGLGAFGLPALGAFGVPEASAGTASTANIVTVTSPGTLNSAEGDTVYLAIQARDSQPDAALTYSATELPDGLSLNPSSGIISGLLTLPSGVGATGWSTTVTATDPTGASATAGFTWNVQAGIPYFPIGPMRSFYSGKCLDDKGAGTGNGTPIQLWTCNGSAQQDIAFGNVNSLQVMGKCIDDPGSSAADGTPLQLWQCNQGDAQVWTPFPDGAMEHQLDDCINAPSGTSGTRLRLGPCDPLQITPSEGERWVPPSTSFVLSSDGKCLDDDVPLGGQFTSGVKVQQWACNGGWGQDWNLSAAGLGANGLPDYTISGVYSGGCLNIPGSVTSSKTKVNYGQCGTAGDIWQYNGSELVNPHSGKCLDDPGASGSNGTQLEIYTCHGGTNQKWVLPGSPVTSVIPDACLANNSSNPANGNPIY